MVQEKKKKGWERLAGILAEVHSPDSQQHCLPADREREKALERLMVYSPGPYCLQVTHLILNSTQQKSALALYRGHYNYFTDEYIKA